MNQDNQYINYINKRWSQLYHLSKEYGDKSISYLMLTNGSGAVANLSFIGALKKTSLLGAWSLSLYFLGIILVGVLIAFNYHRKNFLFDAWKRDVNLFYENSLNWNQLNANDENRSQDSIWPIWVAYGSWACFIFGSILGIFGLFNL